MTTSIPPWADALTRALEAAPGAPFRPIDPELTPKVRELLREGWDRFPFGDRFQDEGRARIARSIPLASGQERSPRLTERTQPVLLLFDPEHPEAVFAALGTNLPPQLWPRAEPTPEGLASGLGPYLAAPFRAPARLSRSVRVHRGNFDDIGLDSIDDLARIIARIESWIDGDATWCSACLDDPWPDDPTNASMLDLRVLAERAREQHPARRPSIAMRTLWSRSVLTIEAGQFQSVIFELRYDPAPFIADLPAPQGGTLALPEDIPVDLIASLLRSGSITPRMMERFAAEGLTPRLAYLTSVLDPAETTTFAMLRALLSDPASRGPAIDLIDALGARALLYELECETDDEALRAKLAARTTPRPAGASAPSTADEDERDGEADGDDFDDDFDDDKLDDDTEDGP